MSSKSPVSLILKSVAGLALIAGSLWLAWQLFPQQPKSMPVDPALTQPIEAPDSDVAVNEEPVELAPVEEPVAPPAPVFSGPYQLDEVSPIYLPKNIRLTTAKEFPILVDGIAHGSAIAAAGTEVQRVRVTGPRQLLIRYLQSEHSVSADQTDIDARITRMKEYRAEVMQAQAARKAQEAATAAVTTASASTATANEPSAPAAKDKSKEPIESQIDWDAFFGEYD